MNKPVKGNGSAQSADDQPNPIDERQEAAQRARAARAGLDTIEDALREISDWARVTGCGTANCEVIEAEDLGRLDSVVGLLDDIAVLAGGRKAMLTAIRTAQQPAPRIS